MYSASIVKQSDEHPSVSEVLLSSHFSPVTLLPSPQIGSHAVLSVFGVKPVSHCVHVSGLLASPPVQM